MFNFVQYYCNLSISWKLYIYPFLFAHTKKSLCTMQSSRNQNQILSIFSLLSCWNQMWFFSSMKITHWYRSSHPKEYVAVCLFFMSLFETRRSRNPCNDFQICALSENDFLTLVLETLYWLINRLSSIWSAPKGISTGKLIIFSIIMEFQYRIFFPHTRK